MKPSIILVAIDFSPPSETVLLQGLELASQRPSAEVHVVTVQELTIELLSPPHEEVRSPVLPLSELAERCVRQFEATHSTHSLQRVAVHAMVGNPAPEIVALAAELDADVIVMGTHGNRGVKRVVLGSVAEKVVRMAGCPVFVVRPKAHDAALRVPEIEPLCPACAEARAAGNGQLWCSRHAEHHIHAHVFSYGQIGQGAARPWGFST